MPVIKMYIGQVAIDKVEVDYSVCDTLHEKEEMTRAATDFLKERNWKIYNSGFIPSFFLHLTSKMDESINYDNPSTL